MAEFSYKIIKHIGTISDSPKGWKRELNLVSWNEREPKYDIRDWAPDHEKMGKGISLSHDELNALSVLISELDK
ncbi:MAG: hypothetical protein JEZ04_05235 [Spirochaetales bacterium]|nr:hypothetical protein [Spirochaetales bacterium]